MPAPKTITFNVDPCEETGGYLAVWESPDGKGGITTQADTLEDLEEVLTEAVANWFGSEEEMPQIELMVSEEISDELDA